MVGVGVVGLGAISKYWLEAIEAHPSTILAAVCDTRPPCDSDAYSVPFYTDHKLYATPSRPLSSAPSSCFVLSAHRLDYLKTRQYQSL